VQSIDGLRGGQEKNLREASQGSRAARGLDGKRSAAVQAHSFLERATGARPVAMDGDTLRTLFT